MTDVPAGGIDSVTQHSWQELADRMVATLVADGHLSDLRWRAILATVPRHVFVPGAPLAEAYTAAVVTQTRDTRDGTGRVLPTSSLSAPDAVAAALDALDLTGHERVLEIGTGTGYVAGLLSHRLGDRQVYSVDIDADLVNTAAERLAALGLHPTLRAGDGYQALAQHAPYDRILATCSIAHVPPEWVRQLAPGGRIVAPLGSSTDSPVLHLVKTADDEVTGQFLLDEAGFMPLRPVLESPLGPGPDVAAAAQPIPHHGTTALDPAYLINRTPALGLFCHLHLPGLQVITPSASDDLVIRHRGSTATVSRNPESDGRWAVTQSGPHRIWDTVETALTLWGHLGHPEASRYGITALDKPHRQYVWLDDPDGLYAWPLDPAVAPGI